ncbi:hypothetical protein ADP71_08960 [Vitreoscilla sp. C1]|uniref:PaaI family thioesterase n=1 Tax=Vitreoscilla sp. (strain C1) TaxID=96942 RepID=UPI000CDC7125|nr:PaaI family thioesterase [Vitreoscilla sp. C1]AUZ04622.1 hypothetical protein ADP71_08960 [Vitreoscilla sp. C1]
MNSAVDYSGLEFLTKIKNGELPHSNMAATTAMRLVKVAQGTVVYEVTPDERHLNTLGGVHGGLYATVMDTITGAAIHSMLDAGINFGTTDLNLKMLRAMKPHHTYRGEGKVISIGRTLLTAEGRIVDENGKIYAYGSASCLVIK